MDLVHTLFSITAAPAAALQQLHDAGAHTDPLVILLAPCALFLVVFIRGVTRR